MFVGLGRWVASLAEPWFGIECAGCRTFGSSPCRDCLDAFESAFAGPVPEGVSELHALVAYDDVTRPFLTSFKRTGDLGVLGRLVDGVVSLLPPDVALLTWAPTTARRRRARGHDHAHLLAKEIGRRADRPVRRLLERVGTASQEGRTAQERRHGIDFRVTRTGGYPLVGPVVVVDDVVTTGATMAAATKVLLSAGFGPVIGVALARTPAH